MPTVKYYPCVCRLISAIAVALLVVLSIQGLSEVALGQATPAPPAVTPTPPPRLRHRLRPAEIRAARRGSLEGPELRRDLRRARQKA